MKLKTISLLLALTLLALASFASAISLVETKNDANTTINVTPILDVEALCENTNLQEVSCLIGMQYGLDISKEYCILEYDFKEGICWFEPYYFGAVYEFDDEGIQVTTTITDENGSVVEETDYYPFGKTLDGGNADEVKLYEGKELDETGQYYYGARYYSPELRMFVQPDSMIPDVYDPQQLNIYAFERNNPYGYTDPSGNSIMSALKGNNALKLISDAINDVSEAVRSMWSSDSNAVGRAASDISGASDVRDILWGSAILLTGGDDPFISGTDNYADAFSQVGGGALMMGVGFVGDIFKGGKYLDDVKFLKERGNGQISAKSVEEGFAKAYDAIPDLTEQIPGRSGRKTFRLERFDPSIGSVPGHTGEHSRYTHINILGPNKGDKKTIIIRGDP